MNTIRTIAAAAALATIAACGGGGQDKTTPPDYCTPRVVTIGLYGDSTNVGASTWGDASTAYIVTQPPAAVIQQAMDARFGAGAVIVTTRAISATGIADLLAGATTANGTYRPWPGDATDDVEVENYGIYEVRHGIDAATYADELRALYAARAVVFETPYPTLLNGDGYAQTTRDVAAQLGERLIDVNAFVDSQPDWWSHVHDGIHPDADGYRIVNSQLVAPALFPLVAPLRCEAAP